MWPHFNSNCPTGWQSLGLLDVDKPDPAEATWQCVDTKFRSNIDDKGSTYISFDRIMIFFLLSQGHEFLVSENHRQNLFSTNCCHDFSLWFVEISMDLLDRIWSANFSTDARLKVSMEREKHPVRASGPQEFCGPFFLYQEARGFESFFWGGPLW